VRWTVDLIFPSPVSWVEVVCTIDDREGKVAAVGAELNLALDPPKADAPTLVDFGAWTLVYTSPRAARDRRVGGGAPGPAASTSDSRANAGPGVHGGGRPVRRVPRQAGEKLSAGGNELR